MNCPEFREHADGWHDGECEPDVAAACQEHAAVCATCAEWLASLQARDIQLRAALAIDADVAARIAERVATQLAEQAARQVAEAPAARVVPDTSNRPARARSILLSPSQWPYLVAAAVAGFLAAYWLMQPPKPRAKPAQSANVARLTVTTGNVEYFDPADGKWQTVKSDRALSLTCPTDSRVRTPDHTQCEIETSDGSLVRLNDRTEVTIEDPSSISLCQGQIWCRSTDQTKFEVRVTKKPGKTSRQTAPTAIFSCVAGGQLMTEVEEEGTVRVLSARGAVEAQAEGSVCNLSPGESTEVQSGHMTAVNHSHDPLLESNWMQPLLVRKGPNNQELAERIDAMLARLGETKISFLYERDIRALGEHALLPLVRYVRSELSSSDDAKRHRAMALVSDLATTWIIPDLVELLADDSPDVRAMSAAALHRLTGHDMNVPPEQWRAAPRPESAQAWRAWWRQNEASYAKPVPK